MIVGLLAPPAARGFFPADRAAVRLLAAAGLSVLCPNLGPGPAAPGPAFPTRLPARRTGRAAASAFPPPARPGDGPLRRVVAALGAPGLPGRWLLGVADPGRWDGLTGALAALVAQGEAEEIRLVRTRAGGLLPFPAPLGRNELRVLTPGGVREEAWDPAACGLEGVRAAALRGDPRLDEAGVASVLSGEPGPRGDFVRWTAAHLLLASGRADALPDALARARALFPTGAAA